MAKDKMTKGAWADLAVSGAVLALRATPNGRANALTRDDGTLRAIVTAPPEDGRANDAVVAFWLWLWGWPSRGWFWSAVPQERFRF